MEREDVVISMVNDKKYNSDTAFFGIVEENSKRASENERVNNYFVATERAILASIKNGDQGVKDVRAQNKRYISERAAILRRKTILKLIALISAGIIVVSGMIYVGGKIKKDAEISKATTHAVEKARDDLKWLIIEKISGDGAVSFSSEEDLIATRSSVLEKEDFEKLNISCDDIGNIYALSLALGDDKNAINVLASSIGDDSNPYESIEDFCEQNGLSLDSFKEIALDNIYTSFLNEMLGAELGVNEKGKGGL